MIPQGLNESLRGNLYRGRAPNFNKTLNPNSSRLLRRVSSSALGSSYFSITHCPAPVSRLIMATQLASRRIVRFVFMFTFANSAPIAPIILAVSFSGPRRSRLWLPLGCTLCCLSIVAVKAHCGLQSPVDFGSQIAPVFAQHCVRCHSPNDRGGDISFATATDLIANELLVPGDPDGSHLIEVISSLDGTPPQMPKEGAALDAKEIQLIRRWISEGAVWPDHIVVRSAAKADGSWWSLQALADEVPPNQDSAHPIDRFILDRLDQHHLSSAPAADRRTLARRLYFDLVGLPPSPEELRAFVQDTNPAAYSVLVDQLLASPRFGERWARHWLDIVHYADTHGFERDQRRDNAWRYRDYVIRSFNVDKPYDQFLREQIAGDVIAPDDVQSVIATGFLAAGPWDYVGQVETKSSVLRRSARALDLDDMVTQVMSSTVAMTVNCARCHDHKLDPILQQEYYQLTAVFAGLKRGDRDLGQQAVTQCHAQANQLKQAISDLTVKIGRLERNPVDLADLVGGGNGYGTGKREVGLDPRTGKTQERQFGDLGNVHPGHFATVESPYVDGVFVPAGATTQITSTGIHASALPENSGKAWDMIRNGPVASQFSTTFGTVDFNSDGHSLIGLHANAGITFDLKSIRNAQQSESVWKLSTVVGYGGRTVDPSAEFRILLDGQLRASGRIGRNDAIPVDIDIPSTTRFLTFLATDGGDGYAHDQVSFGDPRLDVTEAAPRSPDEREQLTHMRSELQRLTRERQELGEPPVLFGVVAQQPPAVHVLLRGSPETPGELVAPGTLSFSGEPLVFGAPDLPEGQRRVALANWITDPENPLTARVIVNRLWHWHFGRGLVSTPSDFGYGGDRPSHPKLLDWLATELIRCNWSLKHIHRLIVTSQTYQMRSHVDETPAVDTDNRMLWRMNPRRLEAEVIRDTVLSVSGRLNLKAYGPGYRDFDYVEAYAPIYTYKTADSADLWRRSIYRFVVRTTPQQFLTALDCPDPANLTPRRNVTTTALQSLALFNNDLMLRQSQYFSERLAREADTTDEQIERAFQLALGRSVHVEELAAVRELVHRQGLMHLCRVLFNTNEFVNVD